MCEIAYLLSGGVSDEKINITPTSVEHIQLQATGYTTAAYLIT